MLVVVNDETWFVSIYRFNRLLGHANDINITCFVRGHEINTERKNVRRLAKADEILRNQSINRLPEARRI